LSLRTLLAERAAELLLPLFAVRLLLPAVRPLPDLDPLDLPDAEPPDLAAIESPPVAVELAVDFAG
jgi:hypothetical protein